MNYVYLIIQVPGYEVKRMEMWDCTWTTIIVRCVLVYLAPLLLHTVDITWNIETLLVSYESKPWKVYVAWTVICYPLFGVVYEVTCPHSIEDLGDETPNSTLQQSKLVAILSVAAAISALYGMVFRRIFTRRRIRAKSI